MAGEAKKSNSGRWLILVVVVVAVVGTVAMRGRGDSETSSVVNEAQAQQSLPKLMDLGADKCIPCKAMMPVLAELEEGLAGHLAVEFLDVWKNPDEAKKYRIKLIPTQIFFDAKGHELFRHEGFFARDDILAEWQTLGYKFELPAKAKG